MTFFVWDKGYWTLCFSENARPNLSSFSIEGYETFYEQGSPSKMDVNGRLVKYHEGWLENKAQDSERWSNHWCVLRSNVLFFFRSTDTREDMHIGTLTIAPESRMTKISGDETSGYEFELYTKNRCNRFRTKKFYEREIWKAYIEGISQGFVPESIDLPPEQIKQIKIKLRQNPMHFNTLSHESRHRVSDEKMGFDSPNSSDSGFFNIAPLVKEEDYLPPVDFIESDIKESPNKPQMYRFCSEQAGNAVPSWFFFQCSREDAEDILNNGAKFGNTLMRVSATAPYSLVISKKIESSKNPDFIHYRVLEESQGYSLDVTNTHKPMDTLSDVMDFFVKTAGKSTTVPMTTNDLKRVKSHEYGDFIKTLPGAEDAHSVFRECEEYVGPPTIPAPPPPPQFKKTVTGHGLRSMSVPMIAKKDLPQHNQGGDIPPPLPPNHPTMRRGSGPLKNSLQESPLKSPNRSLTGSTQSLPAQSSKVPPVPSGAMSKLKSTGPKHQIPSHSTPRSPQNPSQSQASSKDKPPPIPSSPVPPLVDPKGKRGTPLPPPPNQAPVLRSTPSQPNRLDALLEKDRKELSRLSTNSFDESSETAGSSRGLRTTTGKPVPPAVQPKPEKKVPSVASPQFLEQLNQRIAGLRPAPSKDTAAEEQDTEAGYENLEQFQRQQAHNLHGN